VILRLAKGEVGEALDHGRYSLKGEVRARLLLTCPLAALILSGSVPTQAQLTATRAATMIKEAVAQYRECASDVRKKPEIWGS
jgi:hypothetical protein